MKKYQKFLFWYNINSNLDDQKHEKNKIDNESWILWILNKMNFDAKIFQSAVLLRKNEKILGYNSFFKLCSVLHNEL